MSVDRSSDIPALRNIATRLRIASIRATSTAGSGHPTSCCSAAEIMAALFFGQMRFDPKNPRHEDNDRFVLSKGHAAPVLYAAWAEAGVIDSAQLASLRRIDSDLEGHPTPRLPFVDVATGSLGQGICAAIGIALNARRIKSLYRTYALLGDGESAEGSVWEAAQTAARFGLDQNVDASRTRVDLKAGACVARRFAAAGIAPFVLPERDDIDTPEDLARQPEFLP